MGHLQMVVHHRSRWVGLPVALLLIAGVPALLGPGCPGGGSYFPIPTIPLPDPDPSASPPSLAFTRPIVDLHREIGDIVRISWNDTVPTGSALITLTFDPDSVFGNGNEVYLPDAVGIPAELDFPDYERDSYFLDTSRLPASGTYLVYGIIDDGATPSVLSAAAGRLLLLDPGGRVGNRSPVVVVHQPATNYSVTQGESVPVEWCASDPDDAEDGLVGTVPDIVVLFDLDDDPFNDLNLIDQAAEYRLSQICAQLATPAGLPLLSPVPVLQDPLDPTSPVVAYVIACQTDAPAGTPGECADPANVTPIPPAGVYPIDVTQIPPRDSGEPYRVRVTVWDHTNPPVHAYAAGSVNVTRFAPGPTAAEIDLAEVGRTISGTKFMGFDAGGLAGAAGTGVGDIDGDGADDFVIVSRFGRAFEIGNVGSAHLVIGMLGGRKFGSQVPLNSISTTYPGTLFTMPNTTATDGIVALARVSDVTGDGLPEILFGLPYVERLYDNLNDDPRGADGSCYGSAATPSGTDAYPNPLSAGGSMTDRDWREDAVCSNDLNLIQQTPINGGYAILVGSQNTLTGNILGLDDVGQSAGGVSPFGARFRGAWFDTPDLTQTVSPLRIIPDNRFGQTVNSMPPMTGTAMGTPARFGSTLLISAPLAERGAGRVTIVPGTDFTTFSGDVQSFGPAHRGLPCPSFLTIRGATIGDELGYAAGAGDYNLDGSQDILCGAPGANRSGIVDRGIVYVIFGRPDFPNINLASINPPRMEIHGTAANDRFGEMQTVVGDINQDGVPDIGFASQYAATAAGPEAGFIGVLFGGRPLTGENVFTVAQVGTAQLPGIRIYGSQAGGHAGAIVSNAGDVNGDSIDDMFILASDETRVIGGQVRQGVAYVIFGGYHLTGLPDVILSQVGTIVPGLVFVSPYAVGSADFAPIDWVSGAGDVNTDGFDDILIGVSTADFVNPLEPAQRRIDAGECYLIYGSNAG